MNFILDSYWSRRQEQACISSEPDIVVVDHLKCLQVRFCLPHIATLLTPAASHATSLWIIFVSPQKTKKWVRNSTRHSIEFLCAPCLERLFHTIKSLINSSIVWNSFHWAFAFSHFRSNANFLSVMLNKEYHLRWAWANDAKSLKANKFVCSAETVKSVNKVWIGWSSSVPVDEEYLDVNSSMQAWASHKVLW